MRGSDNAFVRLAVAMMGFGLFIGLVFPAAAVLVGVEPGVALSPMFVLFTVSAGLLVGGFNIFLARALVRPRLNRLVAGMQKVDQAIDRATYTGDWSSCTPEQCSLPADTNDEFGEAASAFNHLVERLAATQDVQGRLSSFTERMSANLDVAELCASATEAFRHDLGAAAVAVFGIVQGELALLSSHAVADPEPLGSSDLVLRALRDLDSQTLSFDSGLVIDAAVASVAPSEVSVHPLQVRSAPIGAVVLAFAAPAPPGRRPSRPC